MSQGYQPVPIKLQVAKELDGNMVEKLEMRPPTTADVCLATSMTQTAHDKDAMLFANLTNTTVEFIQALEFYDYKMVESAFGLFMFPLPLHFEAVASWQTEEPAAETSNSSSTSPSTS